MVVSAWPFLGFSLALRSAVFVHAQDGFVPLAAKTFSYVSCPPAVIISPDTELNCNLVVSRNPHPRLASSHPSLPALHGIGARPCAQIA